VVNPPRIAAVVLAHSRAASVETTIDAIVAQSSPPEALIMVANGASTEVLEVLERKAAELPDAEVIILPENLGAAGGFHAGLARACQREDIDAACCFDDDAVPLPGCLAALRGALLELPNIGSIGALTHDGAGDLSWQLHIVGRTEPLKTVAQARALAAEIGPLSVYASSWHALMIPTAAIRKAGNVWAELFHQYEDAEFGLRLRAAGFNNYVIAVAECTHPAAPPAREVRVLKWTLRITNESPTKEYLNIRNDLVVRRRHNGLRFWYGALPLILMRGVVVCSNLSLPKALALRSVYLGAIGAAASGRLGPPPTRIVALNDAPARTTPR
jgi:rhamnopyranosyl-N-acetylglucosaminyl-diphospho-decaprenol beta-1,3/1,4-galactofuranosyltransferase